MKPRVLTTGFGPFLSVVHNPSSVVAMALAEQFGWEFRQLEVSWGGLEAAARGIKNENWDFVIGFGVHGSATEIRYEALGHNAVSSTPDVSGVSLRRKRLTRSAEDVQVATLIPALKLADELQSDIAGTGQSCLQRAGAMFSFRPGQYLCNAWLFQMLSRRVAPRVGFFHIPAFEVMDSQHQVKMLSKILRNDSLIPGLGLIEAG